MTYRIQVSGKVQGVYFRESTKKKANSLGITGTVENTKDGDVVIIATGEQSLVSQLISWCHDGPPQASVLKVKSERIEDHEFSGFIVKR
jgi:acylphosphatase